MTTPKIIAFVLLLCSYQFNYAQWSEQNTAPLETMELFSFVNDDIGYALQYKTGGFHKGVKTIDGGQNWNAFNLPFVNKSYLDMHFFEEDKGAVVYRDLNNSVTPTIVFMTLNGGQTWTDITPVATVVGQGVAKVQFIDENTGFMCVGSIVYRTTDGGQTWGKKDINQSQTTFNTILSMSFNDANNGVLGVFDGTFAYMGGMLTSTDGGATWTESYPNKGGTATGRVVQASSTVAYAGSPKGGYGLMELYKTFNNGVSWDTIVLPDTCNCAVKDFDFKNADEGAVVVASGTSNVDYILSTVDGGVTWLMNFEMPSMQEYDFELTETTGYLTGAFGQYYKLTGLLSITEEVYDEIFLYPNPTSTVVQWNSQSFLETCVVYDLHGKIVMNTQVANGKLNVDFLPKGIYFLELKYGSKIAREKFIKN